jgi:stearoyl-CoA desaturase (delta-9 desaturase)
MHTAVAWMHTGADSRRTMKLDAVIAGVESNECEEAPVVTGPSRKVRVLTDETIKAAERKHFYMFDVAPVALLVPALWVLAQTGVSKVDWAIFAAMWVLGSIGIEIGYHRLFSHAAFQCTEGVKAALVILGSMGAQGPAISWASNHKHHHQVSDTDKDSHSPHHGGEGARGWLRGFWHAHLGWKFEYPYPSPSHYTPALVKDRTVLVTGRYYYHWIALGFVVPALIGGLVTRSLQGALTALIMGGLVRLVVGQHVTWCINSVCHLFGTRPFITGDRSTNVAWLALPTMGGSWHNNHHAFPQTANNGLDWWQLDLCYWVLRGLALFGLVWDIKEPTREQIEKRREKRQLAPTKD